MHHFQYMALLTCVVFLSSLLMPARRHTSHTGHAPSHSDAMLHLFSFAANFGAQLWVTFVAGLTMFYSLPRHMFGQVQSRLFPMFFLWSLVCSAVCLSTFLSLHPYGTWELSHYVQAISLTTCLITSATNSLAVSPIIVSAMLKTFKIEVDSGYEDVVGYAKMAELKTRPDYLASYKTFRRCHGISAMLTVTSLVANIVHLYHVAGACAPL